MKFLAVFPVVLGAVASALGQTVQIGFPTNGTVLYPGRNFTAQIQRPLSPVRCIEVGIALSVAHCNSTTECPTPEQGLGDVLYAGPFDPTPHNPGGFYQNFSLQVPSSAEKGPAIFTLTHLCLLGAGPFPLLEYRNVSVAINKLE